MSPVDLGDHPIGARNNLVQIGIDRRQRDHPGVTCSILVWMVCEVSAIRIVYAKRYPDLSTVMPANTYHDEVHHRARRQDECTN